MGSEKGSEFERDVSKQISNWITDDERDDVLWRSQASGARAKTRAKKNKTLQGQYGDLAATDKLAEDLFVCCVFELKRGYSNKAKRTRVDGSVVEASRPMCLLDCIDSLSSEKPKQFELFARQVNRDAIRAGWKEPVLIIQRDRKKSIIVLRKRLWHEIRSKFPWPSGFRYITIKLKEYPDPFIVLTLDDFFEWCPYSFFQEKAIKMKRKRNDI